MARMRLALIALGLLLAMRPAAAETLEVCADPSNLPFSDERGQGFENRLARLVADDLHATLRYTWNLGRRGFLRRTLLAGACDVVMSVPSTLRAVTVTRPYFASTYVFVTARDRSLQLGTFDDPALRTLRLGLRLVGADGANTPPSLSLARRGLVGNVTGFPMWDAEDVANPQGRIIDAVAEGTVDAAIV